MNTLFAGQNSHVLRVDRVRDNLDNIIGNAAVSATLYESDGVTPVSGFSWPLTLSHVMDGRYEGTMPSNVAIGAGRLYILSVSVNKGSTWAEWRDSIPAQQRRFDD